MSENSNVSTDPMSGCSLFIIAMVVLIVGMRACEYMDWRQRQDSKPPAVEREEPKGGGEKHD